MSKIYEDEVGLFAKVGGWIARPTGPSEFAPGDKTQGKHFGGTSTIGMGKIPGRNKYQEYWKTTVPYIA
jgi:hypothetical protein